MGIVVEFNPDLALRTIAEFEAGNRKEEECIPDPLEAGKTYSFLKKDQRMYWLHGELPLVETRGNQELSRPKASIIILEATHYLESGEVWTRGQYEVIEVFNDDKVHFDGFAKIS